MATRKSGRKLAAYCEHKPTGKAYVRLSVDGDRKTIYLGDYNSQESRENYDKVIGEWLITKRLLTTICVPVDFQMRRWTHWPASGTDQETNKKLAIAFCQLLR